MPVLVHNYENKYKKGEPLNDSDYVVRGGMSDPQNLKNNQKTDPRGHISANGGADFDIIASYGNDGKGFKNGQLSKTTVRNIRNLGDGWNVIGDPGENSYHVSIVPPDPKNFTLEDAKLLSNVFQRETNKWKQK